MAQLSDTEFALLREYLLTACGIDVTPEKRYLFVTRLGDMMADLGCRNFSELYNRLRRDQDPLLRKRLVEAMTTHETSFFRDRHPFDNLIQRILPELAARRQAECSYMAPRLRLLSVGCSTGEEPYSLAMCARAWLDAQDTFKPEDVNIMAVDISRAVLDRARLGRYADDRVRDLPASRREAFFSQVGDSWLIRDDLRAMITFCEANLAESLEHLGSFDIILCRNVIIYFSAELKKKIIQQFFRMLHAGGGLILGASENLYGLSGAFVTRHLGKTTCYFKEGANGS